MGNTANKDPQLIITKTLQLLQKKVHQTQTTRQRNKINTELLQTQALHISHTMPPHFLIPKNADNTSMEGALVLVHFQKSNTWYPGEVRHFKPPSHHQGCSLVDVSFEDGDYRTSIPVNLPGSNDPRIVLDKSKGQGNVVSSNFIVSKQIGQIYGGWVMKHPNINRRFGVVRKRYLSLSKTSNSILNLSWYANTINNKTLEQKPTLNANDLLLVTPLGQQIMQLKGTMLLDDSSWVFDEGFLNQGHITVHGMDRFIKFKMMRRTRSVSHHTLNTQSNLQHSEFAHCIRVAIKNLRRGWQIQRMLSAAPLRQSSMEKVELQLQEAMREQDITSIRTLMKERTQAQKRDKIRQKKKQEQEKQQQGETKHNGLRQLSNEGRRLFGSEAHSVCPVCLESPDMQENNVNQFDNELENEWITLSCNHDVHLNCAIELIDKMWTGNRVHFTYLSCCACRAPLEHDKLDVKLQPHLALQQEVDLLCKEYLQSEKYSMDTQVACYQCEECTKIYAAGKLECGELNDASQVMYCGTCSFAKMHPTAKKCFTHGVLHAVFKCDCCCSIATYDCSGNHYCDTCHGTCFNISKSCRI